MNNSIKNFWELEVWKLSKEQALEIYKITKKFPDEERFGLVSQLRRAATSVMANIAEGFSRYYFKDKIRFYYQARGSVSEVQSFLIFCKDLGYMPQDESRKIIIKYNDVRRLINGLINSVGAQTKG